MTKKTAPTANARPKKSARAARPSATTLTATLIPSKRWHERGAIAIVLVVLVAVLAVGFAAAGIMWSNKVKNLQTETTALRQEVSKTKAELQTFKSEPYTIIVEGGFPNPQQIVKLNVATGAKTVLIPNVHAALPSLRNKTLSLLAVPVGSNDAYFYSQMGETEDPGEGSPIYRLNLATSTFTTLSHTRGFGFLHSVSPDGHFLATFVNEPGTETITQPPSQSFEIINLATDKVVGTYKPKTNEDFCGVGGLGFSTTITWATPTTAQVSLCRPGTTRIYNTASVNY